MFRAASHRLAMRASPLLCQQLYQPANGFEVLPSRVVDKDITAAYEQLPTMRLTLTRQDEFLYKEHEVKSVRIGTSDGSIEVQPSHEYEIAQLVPSQLIVELKDGSIAKFFTNGGFAHINNEGSMDINCVECLPLDDFDSAVAEKELTKANEAVKNAKSDKERAIAEIQAETMEALVAATKSA